MATYFCSVVVLANSSIPISLNRRLSIIQRGTQQRVVNDDTYSERSSTTDRVKSQSAQKQLRELISGQKQNLSSTESRRSNAGGTSPSHLLPAHVAHSGGYTELSNSQSLEDDGHSNNSDRTEALGK